MTADPTRALSSMDVLVAGEPGQLDGLGNRAGSTQPATSAAFSSEYHDAGGGFCAPVTLVEQILADIYAQVLGVERVGLDESFFDLGGDSVSAMRAIAAINATLDVHLAVPTLFDARSVRSLSQQLERHAGSVEKVPGRGLASDL